MTLARIIWNNTRQRKISSILTSLSVAVGVALVIAILTIRVVTQQRFQLGYSGYDMIVGAKGSSLQLVLNAVYQLDTSPGNVPFALYEKLKKDQRVVWAAPFSVGDNFQGFRLIGTSDVFLKNFEVQLDQKLELSE